MTVSVTAGAALDGQDTTEQQEKATTRTQRHQTTRNGPANTAGGRLLIRRAGFDTLAAHSRTLQLRAMFWVDRAFGALDPARLVHRFVHARKDLKSDHMRSRLHQPDRKELPSAGFARARSASSRLRSANSLPRRSVTMIDLTFLSCRGPPGQGGSRDNSPFFFPGCQALAARRRGQGGAPGAQRGRTTLKSAARSKMILQAGEEGSGHRRARST